MWSKIRYSLSELLNNGFSWSWWYNRILIPYILGTATRLHPDYPGYGGAVRVMEEDWDNLIILDACRADVFERILDLNRFDDYQRVISLGSHSSEWTKRNFAGREFGDTVYVSANPHTGMIAGDNFHKVIEMRETQFDDDLETVLPEDMVTAAVEANQKYPNKRLIVHFMQPHAPFVYEGVEPPPYNYTTEKLWEEYEKTLEYVIEYVFELSELLDGKTIVSADHGQTHNKDVFNVISINSHPPRLRLPELVTVPWATMEGERRDILDGETTELVESDDLESRLRHLGYR